MHGATIGGALYMKWSNLLVHPFMWPIREPLVHNRVLLKDSNITAMQESLMMKRIRMDAWRPYSHSEIMRLPKMGGIEHKA